MRARSRRGEWSWLARSLRWLCVLASAAGADSALGGDFDERGVYVPAADAIWFETFDELPERYLPDDVDVECLAESYQLVADAPDALDGSSFLRLRTPLDCPERFSLPVPEAQGSYRARLWIRHGSADARLIVVYPADPARESLIAYMGPTGRATSDGWIELESNDLPIDGTAGPIVYVRLNDFASIEGVDIDAAEVVPSGTYRETPACSGALDAVCGPDAVCMGGACRLGDLAVPPLPHPLVRDQVVDSLWHKLDIFFGGRKTRLQDLPIALASVEGMRSAETAWQFWNGFARAGRELHDWHTRVSGPITLGSAKRRLNVCFIEGDADVSHSLFPKHPQYSDVLVSHVGTEDNLGLSPGDRLIAVDGKHPIAWAREQIALDWGYQVACDDASFADFVEDLGGSFHRGGKIARYARTISVLRCDGSNGTCADSVETLDLDALPVTGGGATVTCDNRPGYHIDVPDELRETHDLGLAMLQGSVIGTTPEEAIYAMVWDTLNGGGDPDSVVNSTILSASALWKSSARGVILDHRAGDGGTLDAAEYLTQLVRPSDTLAVTLMPIEIAGWDGPADSSEGLAAFERARFDAGFQVGSPDHDPDLPVALILQRDGSASDYLPFGMQGAPKVKLFGPGPTAGAFSTFIQFQIGATLSFQLASGETVDQSGEGLIGHGVIPDFVLLPKQSDLMSGVDTLHEAALAWVRQELKP